jgi:hypothetical protein
MLNIDCLCSTCQVCQMTKKERKKCGLLLPKIAESDTVSLGHGMCGSGACNYTKGTIKNTLCLHSQWYIQQHTTSWFEIVKVTNKSELFIQDLFHDTWLVCYPRPQFIVFDNGGEFNREFKQMCVQHNHGMKSKSSKSNHRAKIKLWAFNDTLISFDLENNHETIEEQEYYPIDHSSHKTAGNTMSNCVWQQYDAQ